MVFQMLQKYELLAGPIFWTRKTQLVRVKSDMSKIREKIVYENSGVMAKTGQKTSKKGRFGEYSKIAC